MTQAKISLGRLFIALFFFAWGALCLAQQQGEQTTPAASDSGQSSSQTSSQSETAPLSPVRRDYLLLGTDRLLSFGQLLRYRPFFEMGLTQGYDDGIIVSPVREAVNYTLWTPRVGLLGSSERSSYVLQYAPIVSYFAEGASGVQAYHSGAFEYHTTLNRGWGWDLALSSSYGAYPLSLLSAFNFTLVGGVAVVNPNSILLITTGKIFDSHATIGVHWTPSERNTFVLSSTYDYTDFPQNSAISGSLAGHLHRDTVTGSLTHRVTSRFSLLGIGDVLHVFGPLACNTYDVLGGLSYELREGTALSVSAGPEFGGGICSASREVAFSGSLTSRLSRNWEGYISGGRSSISEVHSLFGSGLTQSAEAGVARRFGVRLECRLDGGYIQVNSVTGATGGSFAERGAYASPHVGWLLLPSLELSGAYSRIYQVVSPAKLNRNQAFVTLEWRPVSRETAVK
jgi:hypothetical protein